MRCPCCKTYYEPKELHGSVPQYSNFGFDVLEYVGRSLFLEHHNEREVIRQLAEQNVMISEREVAFLGKKFVFYVALAHKEKAPEIKKWLQENGGYILHFDGTCDGSSPHLLCAIDEITNIILGSIKESSESGATVSALLQEVKRNYGIPLASVSDMSKANLSAVEAVFLGVMHYVCHFHFLRDIGKDLFGEEEAFVKQILHGVKTKLATLAKKWKKYIDPSHLQCLTLGQCDLKKLPGIESAYLLIVWILDYSSELSGYGFPFDRANLTLAKRIGVVKDVLQALPDVIDPSKYLDSLRDELENVLDDKDLQMIAQMEKKVKDFEQLRTAMRIALPDEKKGLNDDGTDCDMASIKEQVTKFVRAPEIVLKAVEDPAYAAMKLQIEKYWDKLFTEPITVTNLKGETLRIQPQRTNNIMEREFREFNRGNRKKTGGKSLGKVLQTVLAETPLVKNLRNQRYMEIILNNKSTLAERFAEMDAAGVRKKIASLEQCEDKVPFNVRKLLSHPKFKHKINQLSGLKAAA